MRISIFIGGLGSGGAEKVVCQLAEYLSESNDITILMWSNMKPHYVLNNRVELKALRNSKSRNWIIKNADSYWQLIKYVRNSKQDCYIAFLSTTVLLLLSLRWLINVPIIFSVRCYPPMEYGGFIKGILSRILLKNADGAVYQTVDQKNYFPYLRRIRSTVIPNSVYVKESGKEKIKRMIAIGRLDKQKNYSMMLEAVSSVLEEFPEYQLHIWGEGKEQKKIKKLISKYGLEERVFLRGITQNIISELEESEIFLMTSDYEGISNALLEAMAMGLVVVSTDCLGGGARMLIKNRVNGMLVARGNSKQFSDAIREVLCDAELKSKISSNAKKVRELYSPENIYAQWDQYIKQAVKREYK